MAYNNYLVKAKPANYYIITMALLKHHNSAPI